MIDLTLTRERMLAEIEAGDGALGRCFTDPTDPDFLSLDEATLLVQGNTPDELLPVLSAAFSSRFPLLPPEDVFSDLNYLIKKGLGNAYKWGNRRDAAKKISVEAVVTKAGAVVAISDEGPGFDAASVLAQLHDNERYFSRGGSGFSHFHKSRSLIAYANGGRTLLIQFSCARQPEQARPAKRRRPSGSAVRLSDLRPGDYVKVKGRMTSRGDFRAAKISVKPPEELAVIEARLQGTDEVGRRIRVMNWVLAVPNDVEIKSVERGQVGFDALRAGQTVQLAGTYSSADGFIPVKVKLKATLDLEELQGRIETIDDRAKILSVLGIAVVADGETALKDTRLPETP